VPHLPGRGKGLRASPHAGTGRAGSDRVGRAEHAPHLDVVVQERDEVFPEVLPRPDGRRAPGIPALVMPSRAGVHWPGDRLYQA
jgi:hypothetical protein